MVQFLSENRSKLHSYAVIIFVAVVGALNYEIFVFSNGFAPAGLNGICTIIQHVFHFKFGYMTLLVNIPLLIVAFLFLERQYAVKNLVYIIVFSVSSLVLNKLDLSEYVFYAQDGGERIMAAISAGLFNGLIYCVTLRSGGSTGGMDLVASFVNRRHPEFNLVWIVFTINVLVAISSFFSFGMEYPPVILCLVYAFVTSRVNDSILRGLKSAVKFEIVTSTPDELASDLMAKLRHGCTVVPAKGMYRNTNKSLLICVVNKLQIADFEKVIRKYNDCFVIVSSVSGIYGNFKHIK